MIDFPASPTLGQQFTAAGVVWTWDGTKWLPSGLSPTVVPGINDNRIINGDMRIDQRNNGASGTAAGYTVDRWSYAGSQTGKGIWSRNNNSPAPGGFPYGLVFASTSAFTSATGDYFRFSQAIEADMVSDFAWGTSGAQPVTLSFWAYCTLTGTFSGSIQNYAQTRSYPFTYSVPAASTWTKIVITIPGDTGGTWVLSGNGASMYLGFDLGSGASFRGPANVWASANYLTATGSVSVVAVNNAQFLLTGVKLEIGSVATPYNRQSLAKSMADCQRYCQTNYATLMGYGPAGANFGYFVSFPVAMRVAPTVTAPGVTAAQITAGGFLPYIVPASAGAASFNVIFTAIAEL